jgi:hypothetical protein
MIITGGNDAGDFLRPLKNGREFGPSESLCRACTLVERTGANQMHQQEVEQIQ